MSELLSREFCIEADHPALDGHFPGEPIVPGVVLLEKVRAVVRQWQPAGRIKAFPNVKFHHPLYPEQAFRVTLSETEAGMVRFICARGCVTLASGSLILEAED